MRLAYAVSLAGLAGQALALDKSINTALNVVMDDTTALGKSLSAWSGNPFSMLPVFGKAANVYFSMVQCSHAATSSPQLTTDECLTVAKTTGELSSALNTTLENAIADKPKFDRFHSGLIVFMMNKAMQYEINKMYKNIMQKVPDDMRNNAQQLANIIDESFNKAIAAYNPKQEKGGKV